MSVVTSTPSWRARRLKERDNEGWKGWNEAKTAAKDRDDLRGRVKPYAPTGEKRQDDDFDDDDDDDD